ncbi:hypothetical protein NLM27_41765 [Bradyrhizobium sp. CCGB12]|uniref:hypothetical protein n=1 Tax=Bradyrhizobium sp. CCGB12 TaxID=2949632 RepID=UPI0020B3D494|nr:hypothetical protein [Bradyrhizobium sp. CCGB12]MCP3395262.1 hypothetical protein [Bradyrhizobium sp. CCGB12]
MTDQIADVQVAMQYLTWALEKIEAVGNQEAAAHARIALEALRKGSDGKTEQSASA